MNVSKCTSCGGIYSTKEPRKGLCPECRILATKQATDMALEAGNAKGYVTLPEKGFDRLELESRKMGVSIDRAAIILLCPILQDDALYASYLAGKKPTEPKKS